MAGRKELDAEAVRDLWEVELEISDPTGTSQEDRLAAQMRRESIPIISSPPETTWIWSDLHLADPSMLLAWNRPFRDVDEMNRHLLREWGRRVCRDEMIICLGDVAHPDAWHNRRLVLDIRNCPGKRLLVLGNHDTDTGGLKDAGFETMWPTALYAGDPPLALSHVPLRRVPPTAVNVHGHLHGAKAPKPAPLECVRRTHRLRAGRHDVGAREGAREPDMTDRTQARRSEAVRRDAANRPPP